MKREKVSNDPFCILGIVLAEVNFSLKHTLSIDEVLAPYGGFPITMSKPSLEGRSHKNQWYIPYSFHPSC